MHGAGKCTLFIRLRLADRCLIQFAKPGKTTLHKHLVCIFAACPDMMVLADKNTVHQIIPQDNPMIMVDVLEAQDEQNTITSFIIENDNLFVEGGFFSEEGMIENMAQSAALRTGWKGMEGSNRHEGFVPPIGVIGAVKDFRIYRRPAAGTKIRTVLSVTAEIFNATMVSGKIWQGDELLAEGELKIFLQE